MFRDRIATAPFLDNLGVTCINELPISNVRDVQPRVRARWATTTGIQIWCDLGASLEIACVALLSTTLGMAGGSPTVRVRLSDDAGFGTSAWDTGAVDPATDEYAAGNVVLVHATSATGRFLRVDIEDAAADEVDIGRIIAGPLWRPTYSWAYGAEEGRLLLDRRDRNPDTGVEFARPAVANPRTASFSLPYISPDEARLEWRSMLDTIGAAGDVLWLPDDGLSQAELNRRAIFGSPAQSAATMALQRAGFRHHTGSFSITERV
jgi:hypothetical protein